MKSSERDDINPRRSARIRIREEEFDEQERLEREQQRITNLRRQSLWLERKVIEYLESERDDNIPRRSARIRNLEAIRADQRENEEAV